MEVLAANCNLGLLFVVPSASAGAGTADHVEPCVVNIGGIAAGDGQCAVGAADESGLRLAQGGAGDGGHAAAVDGA